MTNTNVILALMLLTYLAAGRHCWQKAVMRPAKRAVLDEDDFDAVFLVAHSLEKTFVYFIAYGSFLLFWPGSLLAGFILSRFQKV